MQATKKSLKYEILLDNYYYVSIGLISINIYGTFKKDCTNLLIKDNTNELIDVKIKILLNNILITKKKIPLEFKQLHVRNLTLGEILSHDKITYLELLSTEYSLSLKYANLSFKQIFEEFVQSNLLTKYKILKLLLLYNMFINLTDKIYVNCVNNAGLLFGLMKETKLGTTTLSTIIYKNLNLSYMLKLSKTGMSIKQEINNSNNFDLEDVDLKKQLMMNQHISDKIKKLVLIKLVEMKSRNSEYYKQLTYVKTLINYPWASKNEMDIFTIYNHDSKKKKELLANIKLNLNEKIYGHVKCKESIIELVAKWLNNSKSLGKAIGLIGPPGVGKTLIAKTLGQVLNIPFAQINLGGMADGTILTGHSITYSGAVPGLIVKKMVEAGKSRTIMFFDELDKISLHNGRNEIHNILIHAIDYTTNMNFMDNFFQDIKFPIDKVLFIFAFNDVEKINKILLDRLTLIHIDAYNVEDKINIINNFVIKEMKNEFGLNDINITILNDDIAYLINTYTAEAGIREIMRKFDKIFSQLNIKKILNESPFDKKNISNINITRNVIDKCINDAKIYKKKINNTPKIGCINALYATSIGIGGIVPILMYENHNNSDNFKLKLTGKQGSIMRESVYFSYTIAMNMIKKEYIKNFYIKYPNGLHIHTLDGATSKDGPSAGIAFTIAFISCILGKMIKHDVSLTGEIMQDGNIGVIGGLEYKLSGAKNAGIKLVFVPEENKNDIDKIKITNGILFDDNFKCIVVNHIKHILDIILIDCENYTTYEKTFDHTKYLL